MPGTLIKRSGRVCPRCRVELNKLLCPADGYLTVSRGAINPVADLSGRVLGATLVLERLAAETPTAWIYAGRQASLGRQVAVKIRKMCDARHLRGIARFQREGRTLATLDHPRVVRVLDLGVTASGTFWMVMEWLEGLSVEALMARGPMTPGQILAISACTADALSALHTRGIVHRHVSPGNVFALAGRTDGEAKLLGFGLVKLPGDDLPSEDAKPVTKKGQIVGDPRVLAPEQALGSAVTPATDIYSLGLTMYAMLTAGGSPFEGAAEVQRIAARLTTDPKPPQVDGRPLKGALVDLVMGFLARAPGSRPRDGGVALAEIHACQALKPAKQLR